MCVCPHVCGVRPCWWFTLSWFINVSLNCAQPVARGRCLLAPCQQNPEKQDNIFNVWACLLDQPVHQMPKKKEGDLRFCRRRRATESVLDPDRLSVWWCEHAGVFSWTIITLMYLHATWNCPVSVVARHWCQSVSSSPSLAHQCCSVFLGLRAAECRGEQWGALWLQEVFRWLLISTW